MPRTIVRPPLRLLGLAAQGPVPGAHAWRGSAAPGYERVAEAFGGFLAGPGRGGALTVRRGPETLVDV
ncbi:MAG: hypothetical protein JWM31_958 [Solirubrobacterales bacterium]|nr:hypothetical protein [Solirubrobacterales bacterium]